MILKASGPKVSIIIRTKNEEQWISHCLKMVYGQTISDVEVVIVDNKSNDNTLHIARKFPVKIIEITNYLPGRAINKGVIASSGEYIACLSAHCIPKHKRWLENILQNFKSKDDKVAGVYGRHVPFKYSSPEDKRDLFITFGLDKRIQIKDTFFHNANSMFPREVWNEIPFNEEVTNIEDRIWGQEVIKRGYKIIYEPEAEVFHCHGIHHGRSKQRCDQTVRILEDIQSDVLNDIPDSFKPQNANIVAFIPLIGKIKIVNGTNLLERVISQIRECHYIKDIVVMSEKSEILEFAKKLSVKAVKRGLELLTKGKSIETTLQYALSQYESKFDITDAVVFVNYLYPFRPRTFFYEIIEQFVISGVDSTVAACKDYRVYWIKNKGKYVPIGRDFKSRSEKQAIYQGVWGLGVITSSRFIWEGKLLGDNIGLLEIQGDQHTIRVESEFGEKIAGFLLEQEKC